MARQRSFRDAAHRAVLPFLALAAACAADDPASSTPAALASGGPVSAEVSSRLASDVGWLADDARQGRRAGTQAGREAGQWIAERLASLGLEPAGESGWTQSLEVGLPARDGGTSFVRIVDGVELGGSALIQPLFCSSGGTVHGPLAWGGYGITNAKPAWDDYAHARKNGALQGAIVLIVRGTPPLAEQEATSEASAEASAGAKPVEEGPGWGNAGSLFMKVMTAKRLGAAAVLVAPHPSEASEPIPPFDVTRSAQASIPCAFISVQVARRLEPAYDALVASLDRAAGPTAFRPASAPIVELASDVVREKGEALNVLGMLRGNDASRTIVVGAHYDHLGLGGEGSLAPSSTGEVHNGADDNASGTAAVLEMARELAAGPRPACNVLFALWSAEELGLLGSEHWAEHPTLPMESVIANLNLDMVGRAGDGKLDVLGVGTAAPLEAWVREAAVAAALDVHVSSSGQGVGGSDHMTFLQRRVPALHFFSGVHADYHMPSDDAERFEADGARRVVALGVDLVRRIAAAPRSALAYVEPRADEGRPGGRMRAEGWSVWFGSRPEYAFEGPGVRLAGTSEGSPAEKAGLLAGDVLRKVGEVEIDTIDDFMLALATYKPGDVVRTRFLRDGELQEVSVTLVPRQPE
jgi:Peptidase family M28/PDZ domain